MELLKSTGVLPQSVLERAALDASQSRLDAIHAELLYRHDIYSVAATEAETECLESTTEMKSNDENCSSTDNVLIRIRLSENATWLAKCLEAALSAITLNVVVGLLLLVTTWNIWRLSYVDRLDPNELGAQNDSITFGWKGPDMPSDSIWRLRRGLGRMRELAKKAEANRAQWAQAPIQDGIA